MHVKYLLLGQEFGDRKYLITVIETVAVSMQYQHGLQIWSVANMAAKAIDKKCC
jgi:hypothetical protein